MKKQFIELQKASTNHIKRKTSRSFKRLKIETEIAQKYLDNTKN